MSVVHFFHLKVTTLDSSQVDMQCEHIHCIPGTYVLRENPCAQ